MVIIAGVNNNNQTLATIERISLSKRRSALSNVRLPLPLSGHCAVQINSTHTFITGALNRKHHMRIVPCIKQSVSGGSSSGLAGLSGDSNISNKTWYLTSSEVIPAEDMVQVGWECPLTTAHDMTSRPGLGTPAPPRCHQWARWRWWWRGAS